MYQIDKTKFGAFVSALRKEKGYTQKELAEKLLISDKAVSKWETGVSIPDTALLLPLAELLGVTVTELLLCERMQQDSSLDTTQVEGVVKTALAYSEGDAGRATLKKTGWPFCFLCAAVLGVSGTLLCYRLQVPCNTLLTAMLLSWIFGAYFCFFVKTKLPPYYDDHKCGLYYDGFFRMNLPGISLNNRNWPHIIRAVRIWACTFLSLYPFVNLGMYLWKPQLWLMAELPVFLTGFLGGLFLPIYITGRKYQ